MHRALPLVLLLALPLSAQDPKKPAKTPAPKPRPAVPAEKVAAAVKAGLGWLARHQSPDGSWTAADLAERCGKAAGFGGDCASKEHHEISPVVLTGLGAWAFAAAGYGPDSPEELDGIVAGGVVKRAVAFLQGCVGADGAMAGGARGMESHFMGGFAFLRAAATLGIPGLEAAVASSTTYAEKGRNPGAGWRYSPRCGDNDSFVTGWGLLFLRAAESAGAPVAGEGVREALAWIDSVTDKDGAVGYTAKGQGNVIDMTRKNHKAHPLNTALALAAKTAWGVPKDDPLVKGGIALLLKDLPSWETDEDTDFWYWFVGGWALRNAEGNDGKNWGEWRKAAQGALVAKQNSASGLCLKGSWDPADKWSGQGGRIYATALDVLVLELTRGSKATSIEPRKSLPKGK